MYPGDVLLFRNEIAGKTKFHLCVCVEEKAGFLFLNSPKKRSFIGDFNIPQQDIPFLSSTNEGYSVLSCNLLLRYSATELSKLKTKHMGSLSKKTIKMILEFIEDSPLLSEYEKSEILEGLSSVL